MDDPLNRCLISGMVQDMSPQKFPGQLLVPTSLLLKMNQEIFPRR